MTSNQLEIFPGHIVHNFHVMQTVTGKPVMPVLKADGYGLGAAFLATLLSGEGARSFAVARLEEAQALRDAGIETEILLMAPCVTRQDAATVLSLNITPTVSSLSGARLLSEQAAVAGRDVPVHIKLDTGFGRCGFLPGEWEEALRAALLPGLSCVGVYSHLSESFAKRTRHTFAQKKQFEQTVAKLKLSGLSPSVLHLANSCAALRFPDMRYDRVRVGSALVGRIPIADQWGLRPACRLLSRVSEVRTLPRGYAVGYARQYKTKSSVRVGIVPAGLYDGIALAAKRNTQNPRHLLAHIREDLGALARKRAPSGFWDGQPLPILGRVGTTALVLDLSRHDIKPGDQIAFDVNPMLVNGALDRVYKE